MRLFFTFQDNASLYMALESCDGGELFAQITRLGSMQPEVVDALEYIHKLGLIHQENKRDLHSTFAANFMLRRDPVIHAFDRHFQTRFDCADLFMPLIATSDLLPIHFRSTNFASNSDLNYDLLPIHLRSYSDLLPTSITICF
ncbi:hypothetical protein L2E82_50822 [Cichorium intybus]|nr:hypothetical protein L2E82_50822 [Cichorium intybus]